MWNIVSTIQVILRNLQIIFRYYSTLLVLQTPQALISISKPHKEIEILPKIPWIKHEHAKIGWRSSPWRDTLYMRYLNSLLTSPYPPETPTKSWTELKNSAWAERKTFFDGGIFFLSFFFFRESPAPDISRRDKMGIFHRSPQWFLWI